MSYATDSIIQEKIHFESNHLQISGILYYPEKNKLNQPLPAIIIGHPGSSVKEQAAGLYAHKLAEQGFITFTFDAAYQGESEGELRGLEDPAQRIEDFKAATSYLMTLPQIDTENIGILGICASGGYALATAAADPRIKAIATVSGVDLGLHFRKGGDGNQDPSVFQNMLEAAAKDRTAVATGKEPGYFPLFPATASEAKTMGSYAYEGYEYYCTDRAQHPRSAKTMPWLSVDRIAQFSAFDYIATISPRPVLLIGGSKAVTLWMTQKAYEKLNQPKEMYLIEGASHVALYDQEVYVSQAIRKLAMFFTKNLHDEK